MTPAPRSRPHIICFGDSLTAGYQSPTAEDPAYRHTPYGHFLQSDLGEEISVVVQGNCGELTEDMVRRFPDDVIAWSPRFVVILGGTNDLGCHLAPADIFRNVSWMYDAARKAGIHPVAVTVPSIRPPRLPAGACSPDSTIHSEFIGAQIARRVELNGMMSRHCRAERIPCMDLFTATSEGPQQFLAARYSNDGLHLTTASYALLADLLWREVFSSRGRGHGEIFSGGRSRNTRRAFAQIGKLTDVHAGS